MSKNQYYQNFLQFEYGDHSFLRFEEDFYRYSKLSIPLTFLSDDILLSMYMTKKPYFRLNKVNSIDGLDHYFYFHIIEATTSRPIQTYRYLQSSTKGPSKSVATST